MRKKGVPASGEESTDLGKTTSMPAIGDLEQQWGWARRNGASGCVGIGLDILKCIDSKSLSHRFCDKYNAYEERNCAELDV